MQHPPYPPPGDYGHGHARSTSSVPPYAQPMVRAPKAPGSSSLFIPVLLSVAGLFFASCAGITGYAVYQAQTPEGKAKHAEDQRKARDNVGEASASLAAVLNALPAPDAPDARCPAGTDAGRAPIVDSVFLTRLVNGRDRAFDERVAALHSIRSREFSDDLLSGADTLRARGSDAGVEGEYDAKRVLDAKLVVVLDVASLTPPVVEKGGFEGGALIGRVVVVDRATGRALCHEAISAASSDSIEYGGGVRLKVKGIPTPTMGKKDLAEAVKKDFAANVKIAIKSALGRIGAAR